jgi:DNA topoisomerase-1
MLLSLPKKLGEHPDTKKDIKLGIGRFGPYIVHEGDYRSIPKTENFFDVDLKKALEMLAQPKKGRGGRAASQVLKDLGKHPDDNQSVQILNGKYGPYVKWGKKNVSVPEGTKPDSVSLEQALQWIAAKVGKSDKKAGKGKKIAKKVETPAEVEVPAKATKIIRKPAAQNTKTIKAKK